MAYTPTYPHDPIEEIATDLFMVRGSIRMNALMQLDFDRLLSAGSLITSGAKESVARAVRKAFPD